MKAYTGMEAIFRKVKGADQYASGYKRTAATSGDESTAATYGDKSIAATSGYWSTAAVNGKDSIAVANGAKATAQGALGCYLVLTEYQDGHILHCECRKVDGRHIKPNTLYKLVNGKFEEA